MEHFITKIQIDKLRHLENIEIELSEQSRRHLLITGKNGSGKTSLLEALSKLLTAAVIEPDLEHKKIFDVPRFLQETANLGVKITFNFDGTIIDFFNRGNFVMAYFPAHRKTNIAIATGVENVKLAANYALDADPANLLVKYMVHLKAQQSFANQENEPQVEQNIQAWFNRFEAALGVLLEDSSVRMEFDYKNYNFLIHQAGRLPFSFNELSDGYSSVIQIVSNLIMRMEQNWLLKGTLSNYDIEGVALIDELETHLHIELQKKILPFLVTFFPNIQFIVTTHSPYVLTSISNATIFDLEKRASFNDMSLYSISDVAEGYFDAEDYSGQLAAKLNRYKELLTATDLSDQERAERAELRSDLKNMQGRLAPRVRDDFLDLELRRQHG